MFTKTIGALALTTIIAVGTACGVPPPNPDYPPPTTAPPTTLPPAPSGERVVFGASISWQTHEYSEDPGMTWELHPGKGLEDIRQDVINKLLSRPTTVWLADISTNSAGTWDGRDGWTADDEWYWWNTLTYTQQGTRVIMVLPHLTADAEVRNPGVLAEIEEARAWLVRAAAEANWIDVVTVDWRQYAGPYIGDDGIHVVGGPEAANAWLSMLASGEL